MLLLQQAFWVEKDDWAAGEGPRLEETCLLKSVHRFLTQPSGFYCSLVSPSISLPTLLPPSTSLNKFNKESKSNDTLCGLSTKCSLYNIMQITQNTYTCQNHMEKETKFNHHQALKADICSMWALLYSNIEIYFISFTWHLNVPLKEEWHFKCWVLYV